MNWDDQTLGQLPDWGPACGIELIETLLSGERPFPCTFAVAAAKRNTLRFGFIEDSAEPDTWWPLLEIMIEYLKIYQDISRDTSLVVFFKPEAELRPMADYRSRFWRILQFLHDNDPHPWPADIPADVDSTEWEFSFNGVPIFVVCNTPAHDRRKSRHSPGFLITFQPRWVFEGLEADSPRGIAARRVIRKRLARFDEVEASPELGAYGDPANREWRQYFLPDDNDTPEPRCPFHHR